MKNLFKGITVEGVLDFTATITAFLLPLILIAAVWFGFELVKEIFFTDVIILISCIVFYLLIQRNKNE